MWKWTWTSAVLVSLLGVGEARPPAVSDVSIDIPRRVVRALLPEDGRVISHTIRRNVWTQNRAPFFRNETFEVALGRGIRAKKGDRDDEKFVRNSVVLGNGFIELNGGWRAHFQVPAHSDFFDGLFRVRVGVTVDHGAFAIGLRDADISWRSGVVSKVITVATFGQLSLKDIVEKKLREMLINNLNGQLVSTIRSRIEQEIRRRPELAPYRGNFSARVHPRGVRVTVHTSGRVVRVAIPALAKFVPPHTRADPEFDGNGPRVRVHVKFNVRNNAVYRSVYMWAKETKSNWTTAEGWSPEALVYRAPAGWKVRSVGVKSRWNDIVSTVTHGHGVTTLQSELGRVRIWGDRNGKDAGRYTGVAVDFSYRLPVVLDRDTAGGPRTVEVRLPSFTYRPPHRRPGDRDFGGHGPHVTISARIVASTGGVDFVVHMRARETRRDWTTAEGHWRRRIYTPPRGWTVASVQGPTNFPNLVRYRDRNHDPETFRTALGTITVHGDRRGDDAGIHTRMIAQLNKTVTIVLRRR